MPVSYVIAIPYGGRPLALDWHLATQSMIVPTNSSSTEIFRRGMPLAEAQTSMVEQALELGAEYILFIEDDTEPPANTVVELRRALASADGDFIACGGIYTTRSAAPEPIVYKAPGEGSYWNWKVGDIFPCWAVGFGCLLLKTSIFRLMPKPWFKTLDTLEEMKEYLDLFPHVQRLNWKSTGVSSDIFFFAKLAKMGFKVLAHGGVLPKHWDMVNYKPCVLPENSYPLQPREVAVEA